MSWRNAAPRTSEIRSGAVFGGEGVQGLGDGTDPRQEGNRFSTQAGGHARAIPALVDAVNSFDRKEVHAKVLHGLCDTRALHLPEMAWILRFAGGAPEQPPDTAGQRNVRQDLPPDTLEQHGR